MGAGTTETKAVHGGGGGGGGGGHGGDAGRGWSHPAAIEPRRLLTGPRPAVTRTAATRYIPVGTMAYHQANYGHWYHGDWHDHYQLGPSLALRPGCLVLRGRCCDRRPGVGYPFALGLLVILQPLLHRPWSSSATRRTTIRSRSSSRPAPTAQPAASRRAGCAVSRCGPRAFVRGDYAIGDDANQSGHRRKTDDTVPHEFRPLVLFATKRYKEAAGAVYAVSRSAPAGTGRP